MNDDKMNDIEEEILNDWLALGNAGKWKELRKYESGIDFINLECDLENEYKDEETLKMMKEKRKEWKEKREKEAEEEEEIEAERDYQPQETDQDQAMHSQMFEEIYYDLKNERNRQIVANMTADELIECIAKGVREGLARNDLAHGRQAGTSGYDWHN